MTLNLLQIVTRALDDVSGFNLPSYIVGNTNDDTARTLLSAAFKVGEEQARDNDWQELSKTATYNAVVGVQTYDLPTGYDRLASDTMWDSTQARPMYGAKTRRTWSEITNAVTNSGISYRWRLHGNKIQLDRPAESIFAFNVEYLSSTYCTSSGGVDREDGWTADTDIPKLPHDVFIAGIRYYFSDSKTLPRASLAGAEYDAIVKSRMGKNKPSETISYAASVVAPRDRMQRCLNIPEIIPH